MTTLAPFAAAAFDAAPYDGAFLREVEAGVEGGTWVRMCMQCGVCAGSCPFGAHWAHSPQKIFMMIRAGAREAVLRSDSMWLCTSCYNCVVRCPRKLPITQIMHGIATHAERLGLAPRVQPTRDLSLQFWRNCTRTGRVNELRLTLGIYFRDGLVAGVRKGWGQRATAWRLLKAGRLNLLEFVRGHRCRDRKGLHAMLRRAARIEARRHPPVADKEIS